MRRSVVLSMPWVDELVPLAQRAERAGLDRVWTTEYNFYDAMIRASLIAASTKRIEIGTGITYAFTRRPVALAAAAADIQIASRGRFTLGLGTGTNGMRSKWYGLNLDKPARRFADVVKLIRAAQQATDGLAYHGEYEDVDIAAYALGESKLFQSMEIWGSGVNEVMLTVAARHCDGVATHPLTVAEGYWERNVENALQKGSREDGSRAKVGAWVLTSINDDEEVARHQARRNLAFYFSTPSYQTAAIGTSWEAAAARVLSDAKERGTGDLESLAAHVTDAMLDDLTISGTPTQVRARIPEFEAALQRRGAEEIVFQQAARGADRDEAVASCATLIACATPEANNA